MHFDKESVALAARSYCGVYEFCMSNPVDFNGNEVCCGSAREGLLW